MAAPRALASVLAVVLEDMDLYTLDDFADFLDGGFAAAQLLVSRIRSDDIVAALHTSVTSDVMGVARAAAEHRLLDCELRSMEESANTLQLHAARGADAMAEKLILHEQLSKATAELVSTRQAAAMRHEALRSTKTELAAVKLELAAAVRAHHEAEQEVAAAKALGLALLDAKAAQRAAETAQAAAEDALADALVAQEALAGRAEQRVALLEEQLSARTSQADVETQTSPPASPALPATAVNNYRIRHRQSISPHGVTFATAAPPHIQPPEPGAQAPMPHSLSQLPSSPPLPTPPRLNQPRRLRIFYDPDSDDE